MERSRAAPRCGRGGSERLWLMGWRCHEVHIVYMGIIDLCKEKNVAALVCILSARMKNLLILTLANATLKIRA